jgi:uncharacterized heparinase superfamily protein
MKGSLASLGRLWRTVRWLKLGQVIGRVRFHLQRPSADLRAAPHRREVAGRWVTPARREPSLLGPTRLRLLADEHDVDDVGWDNPAVALLWRYNLHYFDDLNATDATSRCVWQRALVQRWCDENPPGMGTAWSPYPTSLRIVNWVKWVLGGEALTPQCQHSLAVQTRWLAQRLEWHLLGNHLFANAKALVFAGLFFEGVEADAWLATGLRILRQELPEQILADGGQFERTPMYHALALEDLLDLLNVVGAFAAPNSPEQSLASELRARSSTMLHWLRCMQHPNGALARFNDTAEGIAPSTDDLERYAAAMEITAAAPSGNGLLLLQPSGYVRAMRGSAVALIDVAPIGPDYLPGHAHADTLSFEISVAGRELVVNRGTSVYGTGPRRQWERGTAAHSTVQIGTHDSSEVWAGFRVGRRARPRCVRASANMVEGAHDGYLHLPGAPLHRRRWTFDDHALLVEDELVPIPNASAVARWHFAPGLTLAHTGPAAWRILDAERDLARIDVLLGAAQPTTTQHALRFGVLVDASTLDVQLVDGYASVRLTWIV